jgi:hypothetical protein
MPAMQLLLCRNRNCGRLNIIQAGCSYVHGLYCKVSLLQRATWVKYTLPQLYKFSESSNLPGMG